VIPLTFTWNSFVREPERLFAVFAVRDLLLHDISRDGTGEAICCLKKKKKKRCSRLISRRSKLNSRDQSAPAKLLARILARNQLGSISSMTQIGTNPDLICLWRGWWGGDLFRRVQENVSEAKTFHFQC
jgi:hypothetical protein